MVRANVAEVNPRDNGDGYRQKAAVSLLLL